MELDQWQKDVLNTDGNIVLRSGRQVGKSTVISIKAATYAVKNAKKSIMIISATERQAYLLFSKVLAYIHDNHKSLLKIGKDRPTKSEIKLKNGSIIRCLPTGLDGLGIRGYTVDLLIADEAAFIPNDVYPAITPAILTTGGNIILLSTPFGREGYFYDCFSDSNFTSFHVSSPEVAEARPEPMRSRMLQFIETEKKRMSNLQFAQEYLGEFVDEFRQYFKDELIKENMVNDKGQRHVGEHFLGVDIARMGDDASAFCVVTAVDDKYYVDDLIITRKTLTTETEAKIIELDKIWNFKKIGIDSGSGTLGVSVFDHLKDTDLKGKIEAMNNRKLALDKNNRRNMKLQKEDFYDNLRAMLQRAEIKLLKDDELAASMKSIQYELDDEKKSIRIFGSFNDPTEALVRAAYLAKKTKGLNFEIHYI